METDIDKLNRILQEIYEHGGTVTLWSDAQWVFRIQTERPDWAVPILDKWYNSPHVLDERLKQGTVR